MEQENKRPQTDNNNYNNSNTNAQTDTGCQGSGGVSASGGAAPTMDQLMAQTPALSPLSGWLKCLRKPALSLEYSIQKRHIPDLDEASGMAASKGNASTGTNTSSGGQASMGGQTSVGGQASVGGQNSDVMDLTGGFAIRYFDLAMGAMGLLLLGCLWKGCCCLKRIMK